MLTRQLYGTLLDLCSGKFIMLSLGETLVLAQQCIFLSVTLIKMCAKVPSYFLRSTTQQFSLVQLNLQKLKNLILYRCFEFREKFVKSSTCQREKTNYTKTSCPIYK